MSKKRKTPNRAIDEENDKPDFAADLFAAPKKQNSTKTSAQNADSPEHALQERLGKNTLDKLNQLKERIQQTEDNAPKAPASAARQTSKTVALARQTSVPGARTRRTGSDDKDLSFAELFDPEEDDAQSFEELLKDSKQDWKEYK